MTANKTMHHTKAFDKLSRTTRITLITLIIVFGFVMRVYNIDGAPAGIYPDEAQNGYDAYHTYKTGTYLWFYPDNNGREGLYINLIALSFALFGVSIFSFKFVSILIGTLTILGTYLLSREVFWRWHNGAYLALMSALFVAGSFWHVMFSRIGFRAILLPFVLVFSFWLLLRGLRLLKERRAASFTFLCAGLIFGLGIHTYIAFRIAPAALVVLFIALLVAGRFRLRTLWRPALLFLSGTLISAAPLLWTFYTHPAFLTSRASDISIFSPQNNHGDLLGTLGTTLTLSLAKYNFWGDQNWRHGYPPYPTLEPITGIFFLIGLFTSITVATRFFILRINYLIHHIRARTLSTQQRKRPTWPSIHLFLLSWFILMLAPEFLTTEGLPHALRAIGTLPVVYIFAALGVGTLWQYFEYNRIIFRELFVPLLGLILLYITTFNIIKYHVFWTHNPHIATAFNKNITDIARDIAAASAEDEKVTVAGPLERLVIKLLNTDTKNLTILYKHEIPLYTPAGNTVIIYVTGCSQEIIDAFGKRLPNLTVTEHTTSLDTHYCTITSSLKK